MTTQNDIPPVLHKISQIAQAMFDDMGDGYVYPHYIEITGSGDGKAKIDIEPFAPVAEGELMSEAIIRKLASASAPEMKNKPLAVGFISQVWKDGFESVMVSIEFDHGLYTQICPIRDTDDGRVLDHGDWVIQASAAPH